MNKDDQKNQTQSLTIDQQREVEADGSDGCYTAYESSLGWIQSGVCKDTD